MKPEHDWAARVIHFVFGCLFGLLPGGLAVTVTAGVDNSSTAWIFVPLLLSCLVFGLIAAFFGDRFWETLRARAWWQVVIALVLGRPFSK